MEMYFVKFIIRLMYFVKFIIRLQKFSPLSFSLFPDIEKCYNSHIEKEIKCETSGSRNGKSTQGLKEI